MSLISRSVVLLFACSLTSLAQTPSWSPSIDAMMAKQLAATKTPGAQIAIVEHGNLVFSKGYGVADVETGRPVTDQTLFQVGSIAKLFTGTLLAQLASDGKLDLHAPISRYVTQLSGRRVGAVTAHHLLTQSAGLVAGSNQFGGNDDSALGTTYGNVGDTMVFLEPGRVPSYSNPGFAIAGYVAERATGRRYADLVDSMLLRPLGMPRASFRQTAAMASDFSQPHVGPPEETAKVQRPMPANAAEWPAGFLFASARELTRLAIPLMSGGMLDGRRVLSADAVRLVTSGHIAMPGEKFARFGYGLDVDSVDGRRVWRKNGLVTGYSALLTTWPDQGLAIAVLTNARAEMTDSVTAQAAQIVAGIAARKPSEVRAERDATPAERVELAGTYTTKQATIAVTDSAGALWVRQPNGRLLAARLTANGSHLVITGPGGVPLPYVIMRDTSGQVRFLHRNERAYVRLP